MKNMKKLILISTVLTTGSAQAVSIGAYVEGGLWGSEVAGGLEQNYAYVEGNQVETQAITGIALAPHTYRAEASFNVGELSPVLRTEAYFDGVGVDENISASAYAIQTYQNISGTTQTYSINLNLHGSVLRNPGSSYIDAEFQVYSGTDLFTSYTQCSGGSYTYIRGFTSYACGNKLATGLSPYIEIATDGEYTLADTVSFTVGAGETFMIYAGLKSLTFGGYADAFNTFSMSFEDTTNLAALGVMPSAVPVPAAAWLFTTGLVGLLGVARRKARA